MTPAAARTFFRVLGSCAGLFGLCLIGAGLVMLFAAFAKGDPELMMGFFALLVLIFGVYFCYVAYLTWFRLSPLVVRHLSTAVGFGLWVLVTSFLPDAKHVDPTNVSEPIWMAFEVLGVFVVAYYAYRFACSRLSGLLAVAEASPYPGIASPR